MSSLRTRLRHQGLQLSASTRGDELLPAGDSVIPRQRASARATYTGTRYTASSRKKRICLMSHHLDTPLAAQSGQLFIDDLYVFPGEGSTIFVMDVNSDITGVRAEPGFHPEARYEFKIHTGGAEYEDLTYRVSFGEPDPEGRQVLGLHILTGDKARDDSAPGELVLEGRTGEAVPAAAPGSGRGVSATPSTSTCRFSPSSTARWRKGPPWTCLAGIPGTRVTALRAPPSSRSCSRCPTPPRSCARLSASVFGARRSSPPTRVDGVRSTAAATR